MSNMVRAPFTAEQVASINGWQGVKWVHPFTCPFPEDHADPDDNAARVLRATLDCLVCASCDYTQKWVHDFMADGSWRELRNPLADSPRWKRAHEGK